MKRIIKSTLFFLFFSITFSQTDCSDNRYLEEIFDVNVQYNVEFGENTNENFFGSEYVQTLYMDIYEPAGDELLNRPLIIFMFGGAFVTGAKSSSDIVNLCLNYASRGYVAVAIDYRLTPSLLIDDSDENAYEAVIKGIHDLKASIRFFRMDDELYNTYRIDSGRIYAGGVSAGAIASLNATYINEEDEALSLITAEHLEELGGIEGDSGNPGYESNVYGIVNLCGAIGHFDWIGQPDIPIVSMHGNEDTVIPYSDDLVTLFGLDIQVYGSLIIHQTMLELDNYSMLYTYEGEDHVPFSSGMNFESEYSADFLYEIVCDFSDSLIGDINQDNILDILDIIMLINFIIGNDIPNDNQYFLSDLNDDTVLNVLDVIMLLNLILGS